VGRGSAHICSSVERKREDGPAQAGDATQGGIHSFPWTGASRITPLLGQRYRSSPARTRGRAWSSAAPAAKPRPEPSGDSSPPTNGLILVTDGIVQRRTEGGGTFGVDGIRNAIAELHNPTAAATAMSILQAVTDCWREPLEDDGKW
jgi:hypothetical protein